MFIIYTNFIELESPMPHAKIQDHGLLVLEKVFEGFYHILAWWSSWSYDLDHSYKLLFPFQWRLHMKFGFDWPSSFREDL